MVSVDAKARVLGRRYGCVSIACQRGISDRLGPPTAGLRLLNGRRSEGPVAVTGRGLRLAPKSLQAVELPISRTRPLR